MSTACKFRFLWDSVKATAYTSVLVSLLQADLTEMSYCAHVQATLQQAIVKSAPSDDNLQIALVLAGKRRFMDRPKDEALQKTLLRMQKNAMPTMGTDSFMSDLHTCLACLSSRHSSRLAAEPLSFIGVQSPLRLSASCNASVLGSQTRSKRGRRVRRSQRQSQRMSCQ